VLADQHDYTLVLDLLRRTVGAVDDDSPTNARPGGGMRAAVAAAAACAALVWARRRRTAAERPGGSATVVDGPRTRLPRTFAVLDAVTAGADAALGRCPDDGDALRRCDLAVYVRGVNALKSARALLEDAHWETASGPARQLFELVVNMEHLAAKADRSAAARRWAAFGVLQRARGELRRVEYDRGTGRRVDEERAAALADAVADGFPEFVRRRTDGRLSFARSWSGKTVRELAEASPAAIRKDQYEQLFSAWSEEVHGAPAALVDLVLDDGAGPDWVERAVAADDVECAQVAAMAVVLFLELVRLLPLAPAFDPLDELAWTLVLREEAARFGSPRSP
jgi:hypothetical protein